MTKDIRTPPRAVATIAAGVMPPSQLLRKFASYPRQHELALALREIGRIERALFIFDWLLDADMQRRANIGLNLLAAIIIYWNTKHLGQAVSARKQAALDGSPELLSHISPLGWAHILLTSEYRWKNR